MKTKCFIGMCVFVFISALVTITLPALAGAETITWLEGDGSWSEPSRWDPNVPANGDIVNLTSYGTVTIDVDTAALQELNIDISGEDSLFVEHSANTLTLGASSSLFINSTGNGTAQYTLSGGTLIKTNSEVKIGTDGIGYFYHEDGTFQFSGAMYLGDSASGHGYYFMSGGEIVEGPNEPAGIVLGEWGGTGTFAQSGGTVTVDNLTLARQEYSTGEYFLSNNAALSVNELVVGHEGTGEFNQTGGINTIQGDLTIGNIAGSSGTYNLSGSGTLTVRVDEYIGREAGSWGTFNQAGGDHQVGESLYVDMVAASKGVYNLSGGTLDVYGDTIVGSFGDAQFNQGPGTTYNLAGTNDGGVHTIGGSLIVGRDLGSTGTYNLSGGKLFSANTFVGNSGTGVFEQIGGEHYVGVNADLSVQDGLHELIVARFEGSTGTYNLSGNGVLHAAREIVGDAGFGSASIGEFDQSGDSDHTIYQDLIIGQDPMSSGTFRLSDTARLAVHGNIYLGDEAGTGRFEQTGGSLDVNNGLYISSSSESGSLRGNGAYYLQDGTLTADTIVNQGLFAGTAGENELVVANGFINGGTVAPGNSPGTLTITGDYVQLPNGVLQIELYAADSYDILNISGTAKLDGTLSVLLGDPSYALTNGIYFDILTAQGGLYGFFKTENILIDGWNWQVEYLDQLVNDGQLYALDTVRLTANAVPIPGAVWLLGSGLIGLVGFRHKKPLWRHAIG